MARSTLAGLVLFAFFAAALAAQQRDPTFREAGVCSRCHVVQVIEWSASKHTGQARCETCHGTSAAHVANERNEVKPDRLVRGSGEVQVALVCGGCHRAGCPKSGKASGCLSCHHQHALSNPNNTELRQPAGAVTDPNVALLRRHMAEGERHVAARDWRAARDSFAAAIAVAPKDRGVAARLRMAERRLNPAMAGLEIVGDGFDAESGLPLAVRVKDVGIEMLLVPGGEVDIGSERWSAARPVHAVYGEPFYLGKYEVTQDEWGRLGVENPSPVKDAKLPVYGISWNEAQQWISRLNARVGSGFRLPTEAEWERAALAGRPGRDDAPGESAWYRENAAADGAAAGGFREAGAYRPRAVGLKKANAGGFFDMKGNVAEWCSSLFRPYPYDSRDGRESMEPAAGLRVIRGGAFADSAEYLDAAFRHGERPERRNAWAGLRLAR